jgi:polar amino acid transport system substrate-binding protein
MSVSTNSFRYIFALVLLFAALGSLSYAQKTEVHFATGEWAPYTSEKMPGYGAAAEIVTAACDAAGIKAVYDFLPWKRAEQNVVDGSVFAAFPYFLLPERIARPEIYAHSDPLFSAVVGFLYCKKNSSTSLPLKYEKPEDLRNYRIGVLSGTHLITDVLDKAGVKYEETPEIGASIKKLALGRIDFVIEDRAVAWDQVKLNFPARTGDFAFLDRNFAEKTTTHLLVSRKFPSSDILLKQFNDGLRKIKANGRLRGICDRYGIAP